MKNIKLIEAYLEGNISEIEKQEFEQMMKDNVQLSLELNLHKEINEAIQDNEVHEFRLKIKTLIDEDRKPSKSTVLPVWLKLIKYPLAATILLLIGISLWQILIFSKPGDVFSSYYQPYSPDLITRSASDVKSGLQLSFLLYQKGEYEASFEILQNYLRKNYDNQTARFFYSLNAIELGKLDLAISGLEDVEKDSSSPYSLHARWYLALTWLKLDKSETAREYLIKLTSTDNIYNKSAKKVLKKLRS